MVMSMVVAVVIVGLRIVPGHTVSVFRGGG